MGEEKILLLERQGRMYTKHNGIFMDWIRNKRCKLIKPKAARSPTFFSSAITVISVADHVGKWPTLILEYSSHLASLCNSFIRSELDLHLQKSLPLVANSEHTLCSDFHQVQLLHSLKWCFYIKVADINWASDAADCILSALWLNRRFQFPLPVRLLNPSKQKYSDEEAQLLL